MVAFAIRQAEQPFLEDRVAAVPQREGQAHELPVVGKTGDAVLAPAIGSAARLVVGEIIPRRAAGAVVLAHGAPLSLTEIRAPPTPILYAVAALLEALLFSDNGLLHALALLCLPGQHQQAPCVERAGDGPGLRGGAAGLLLRSAVE